MSRSRPRLIKERKQSVAGVEGDLRGLDLGGESPPAPYLSIRPEAATRIATLLAVFNLRVEQGSDGRVLVHDDGGDDFRLKFVTLFGAGLTVAQHSEASLFLGESIPLRDQLDPKVAEAMADGRAPTLPHVHMPGEVLTLSLFSFATLGQLEELGLNAVAVRHETSMGLTRAAVIDVATRMTNFAKAGGEGRQGVSDVPKHSTNAAGWR